MAVHKVTFLPLNVTVEVDDEKYPLSDHGKPGEREKPPLQVKRNGDFNRNFRGIYAVQIVIETADLERKRSRRQIIV